MYGEKYGRTVISYAGGSSWTSENDLKTAHVNHKSLWVNDHIIHIDGCLKVDRWSIKQNEENMTELQFMDDIPNPLINRFEYQNQYNLHHYEDKFHECYRLVAFQKPGN